MSLFDQLGGILQQYAGGRSPANDQDAINHYQEVARQAPQSSVAGALSSVFRSPATGTFGQNISSMFGQSDPNQRAGILNQIIASAGPGILATLGLGGGTTQVTPAQADQVSPAAVEQAANHAQNQDPSIIDRASQFYAQHPTLVQALGAGAAVLAMQHMSQQ